jgi:hypothetical protein
MGTSAIAKETFTVAAAMELMFAHQEPFFWGLS